MNYRAVLIEFILLQGMKTCIAIKAATEAKKTIIYKKSNYRPQIHWMANSEKKKKASAINRFKDEVRHNEKLTESPITLNSTAPPPLIKTYINFIIKRRGNDAIRFIPEASAAPRNITQQTVRRSGAAGLHQVFIRSSSGLHQVFIRSSSKHQSGFYPGGVGGFFQHRTCISVPLSACSPQPAAHFRFYRLWRHRNPLSETNTNRQRGDISESSGSTLMTAQVSKIQLKKPVDGFTDPVAEVLSPQNISLLFPDGPRPLYPSALMCPRVHGCLGCTRWIWDVHASRGWFTKHWFGGLADRSTIKPVVYVQQESVHSQGGGAGGGAASCFRATWSAAGVNKTNHVFLTARDAGTDEACAISYTPAFFCNKSIKLPSPVIWKWAVEGPCYTFQ